MAKEQPADFNDVSEMVKGYARQELVDPMRHLGRFVAFGIAGALCLGLGLVFLAVGVLRVLQSELSGSFNGNWTWAPYLLVFVIAAAFAGLFAWRITKTVDPD